MKDRWTLPLFPDEALTGDQPCVHPAEIICDDVLHWAETYTGPKFHAMLCDPPYHLISDTRNGFQRNPGTGPYGRHTISTKGFMGKEWDGGAIAFQPETWKALARHLLPGAFGVCFASSRGWHRLACAIEDAGLIIHPSIFGWGFGSGFPKATRIDTRVDQRGGIMPSREAFAMYLKQRKAVKGYTRDDINEALGNRNSNLWSHWTNENTTQPSLPTFEQFAVLERVLDIESCWRDWFLAESEREIIGQRTTGIGTGNGSVPIMGDRTRDLTAPATPLAQVWAGHRYGLQTLKPACEPLIMFSKPLNENLFCAIITEISILMEVMICIRLSARDAEQVINPLHQQLRAVVEAFARGHADIWESIGRVKIAGDPSASNLANVTLQSFVAGPVPTPGEMRQLAQTILTGAVDDLSAKAMLTSVSMGELLENIGSLWSDCLGILLAAESTSITAMETSSTIDLKILRSLLSNSMLALMHPNGLTGFESDVHTVAAILTSLSLRWQSLSSTTAIEPASEMPANLANALEGKQKAGASLEPIIVFQVPYQGRSVQSITQTGAGALNIDGGRINSSVLDSERRTSPTGTHRHLPFGLGSCTGDRHNPSGRWPANFCLSHLETCVRVGTQQVKGHHGYPNGPGGTDDGSAWASHDDSSTFHKRRTSWQHPATDATGHETVDAYACAPGCPVAALDAQAGERSSHDTRDDGSLYEHMRPGSVYNIPGTMRQKRPPGRGDTGGASRFFHVSSWSLDVAERLAQADPVRYEAKASRSERDAGLEGMPLQRTSAYGKIKVRQCRVCHSRRNDGQPYSTTPSCGHDDWEWVEVTENGSRGGAARNHHPCCKPIKLTQWLATLLLPPAAYAPRRILIPFAGVASEGLGAMLAGWEEIVMIEQDQDYVNIARERLAYWARQRQGW